MYTNYITITLFLSFSQTYIYNHFFIFIVCFTEQN